MCVLFQCTHKSFKLAPENQLALYLTCGSYIALLLLMGKYTERARIPFARENNFCSTIQDTIEELVCLYNIAIKSRYCCCCCCTLFFTTIYMYINGWKVLLLFFMFITSFSSLSFPQPSWCYIGINHWLLLLSSQVKFHYSTARWRLIAFTSELLKYTLITADG